MNSNKGTWIPLGIEMLIIRLDLSFYDAKLLCFFISMNMNYKKQKSLGTNGIAKKTPEGIKVSFKYLQEKVLIEQPRSTISKRINSLLLCGLIAKGKKTVKNDTPVFVMRNLPNMPIELQLEYLYLNDYRHQKNKMNEYIDLLVKYATQRRDYFKKVKKERFQNERETA